ncbi:MAG: hypothetical protein DMG61_00825 [Acidobacteria bacterium]|nr:MAG: hypothetical protein DMG61_00825 [Acidobacteriota bacterium]
MASGPDLREISAIKNSLLFPCKFPAQLQIACVYAGPVTDNFFRGNYSLLISLRREFQTCNSGLLT